MKAKLAAMVVGLGVLCSAPFAQTVNMTSTTVAAPFPVGLTPRIAVMQGFVTSTTTSPSLAFPDQCSAGVAVPLCGARDVNNAGKNVTWAVSSTTNRVIFNLSAAVSDTITCVVVCQ